MFFPAVFTYSANVAGFLDIFPGIFEIGRLPLDFLEIRHSRSFSKSDILGPPEHARVAQKIETILHTWGEKQPEKEQDEATKLNPERERFLVPHASRDPRILKDMNLENEEIFEIIRNPPEEGVVRIFEKPEFWDSTIGLTHAVTTQGIATIQLPSGPLSMDGAQWHLLKHTLTTASPNSLGSCLQNELIRQYMLDKNQKHSSFS